MRATIVLCAIAIMLFLLLEDREEAYPNFHLEDREEAYPNFHLEDREEAYPNFHETWTVGDDHFGRLGALTYLTDESGKTKSAGYHTIERVSSDRFRARLGAGVILLDSNGAQHATWGACNSVLNGTGNVMSNSCK